MGRGLASASENKGRGLGQEQGKGAGMSDAMSNREIEDVLSSIRRLVARESERPAPGGRLVLTEAQRVAVNDSRAPGPASEDAGGSDGEGAGSAASAGAARARLQANIAELGAAGCGLSGDATASHAPAGGTPAGEASVPDGARSESRAPVAEPVPAAVPAGRDAPARAFPAPGAAPDTGAETAPDTDYGEAEEWHGPDWSARGGRGATGHDNHDEAETFGTGAAGDEADDGDSAPVAAPAGNGARDEDAGPAETLIDEDMLRALVAQLVREELRGQLGERITMQVRKLVRAEIARALDEREYL